MHPNNGSVSKRLLLLKYMIHIHAVPWGILEMVQGDCWFTMVAWPNKYSGDSWMYPDPNVPRHGKSLYFRPISTMGTRTLGVHPSLSLEIPSSKSTT